MNILKDFNYICVLDGQRHFIAYSKSLSNFFSLSGSSGKVFLFPVLSAFFPAASRLTANRMLQTSIYISQKSASNDLTVSTGDLQEKNKNLADNAFRDVQVKEGFGMRKDNLN